MQSFWRKVKKLPNDFNLDRVTLSAFLQAKRGAIHCAPETLQLGLAWLGLAWLGLAWLGLAWLGLAWLGLAFQVCFDADVSAKSAAIHGGFA
jgi:hypothetical protein